MNIPLLLIHFNRPAVTIRQLEHLRAIAPRRLYVLCDAPRPGNTEEARDVSSVRSILMNIPWDAEVCYLFREENLGCFRNLSSGISWFLELVGEGIILEDDCIPHSSFFSYCEQLLERYRFDDRVYAICGHNHSAEDLPIEESYGFSNYFECWGWATWLRAWRSFDYELLGWSDESQWDIICRSVLPSRRARLYWRWMFYRVSIGKRDTWAYRYLLSIWRKNGLTIIPSVNLVSNIGFIPGASHTSNLAGFEISERELLLPLKHPKCVRVNPILNLWLEDSTHSKAFLLRVSWILRVVGLRRASVSLHRWALSQLRNRLFCSSFSTHRRERADMARK